MINERNEIKEEQYKILYWKKTRLFQDKEYEEGKKEKLKENMN